MRAETDKLIGWNDIFGSPLLLYDDVLQQEYKNPAARRIRATE
jgi:hypothetical protein